MSYPQQIILCLIVFSCLAANAQQPFEEYGYKVKVATLSKGKYVEFFDQDTLVEIGSVVLNTVTGKLAYFVVYDTSYSEADLHPEVISRWLSPDPLSEKFYDYSPYNFVYNNPIRFVDPDGRAPLDDYYSKQGRFLGSDGAKTNDIRIIDETDFMDIRANNGGTTSQAATQELQENSAVVTVQEPAESIATGLKQEEGQNEKAVFATLDTKNATLSYEKATSVKETKDEMQIATVKGTGDLRTVPGSKGTKVIVGLVHTHKDAGGLSEADRQTSRNINAPVAVVDPTGASYYSQRTGDKAVQGTNVKLLKTFLEISGKKPLQK